jgi:tetratricopeptide (TPR) repeat protein
MNAYHRKDYSGPKMIWPILQLVALLFMVAESASAQDIVAKTSRSVIQTASLDAPGSQIPPLSNINQVEQSGALSSKKFNDHGIVDAQKGQYDLAISEFTKAIAIQPSAETYNNRGIAYSRKGQYDLAIADFTRAINIAPNEAKTRYNRGITYATNGRYDLAISDLTKALKLQPADSSTYDIMGSVHMELACLDWKMACEFGNCGHLEEAAKVGLCADRSGTSSQ